MTTAHLSHLKMSLPGPVNPKRRRMRSGGNVSTNSNNNPKLYPGMDDDDDDDDDESKATNQGGAAKCKGATTIPIFLKKTYKMIDTCVPSIASWTTEGDMFVVKDPDLFASQVIPQYFDHNKFSSFARQLNFYGFRKMQSKPIRNSDFDAGTAKHVTFFNENFKRGRCDLLKKIQRSTRGGNSGPGDATREMQQLRDQVSHLEQKISDMSTQMEERVRRLELDMLGRLEQMMLAVQQQQQTQMLLPQTSIGTQNSAPPTAGLLHQHSQGVLPNAPNGVSAVPNIWGGNQLDFLRNSSVASALSVGSFQQPQQQQPPQQQPPQAQQRQNGGKAMQVPTLPPHPKQKNLPMVFPGVMDAPPDRMNSLRGFSFSRGLSGGISGGLAGGFPGNMGTNLSRGASTESNASGMLMRNSWEDKFFSMLMLDEANAAINGNTNVPATDVAPTPMAQAASFSYDGPIVSDRTTSSRHYSRQGSEQDLSDVSTTDGN